MALFQKGEPRLPNAGRKTGTPNKATLDIREACRKVAPLMVAELLKIAQTAESESARVQAIKEVLDRAYGKSTIIADITMKNDIRELTRAQLLAIAGGSRDLETGSVEREAGALH